MTSEEKQNLPLAPEIHAHLEFLYEAHIAEDTYNRLVDILLSFMEAQPAARTATYTLSEKDAILITYADQFSAPGRASLQVLTETAEKYLAGVINSIHLLPFYPYSSDDGFSVIDFRQVDPQVGGWEDIAALQKSFRLMFDAVVNHVSVNSDWFQKFLQADSTYENYFITEDPQTDLSQVTRPRTHPLLTPFNTSNGTEHVWTTFSTDQVDLNFANPDVLLEILEVLLYYVSKGAELIRLDAIGYLWKTIGTSCIHLPQTHRAVQLMRSIMNTVAPATILITETNVPHQENISYFGNGENEAQMVYNFALPPLILHSIHSGDAQALSRWAKTLHTPGSQTTFFNFTASHDGIGVMPAKGLLTDVEIQNLVDKTITHGGRVNSKTNADGSISPYELNITLFDALSNPNDNEDEGLKVGRFMVSQAMMLALKGVPGIYVHSLAGSSNNLAGVKETGHNRTINREKWDQTEIESRLSNPDTIAGQVFQRYRILLKTRSEHPAFHPNGEQQILMLHPGVFALLRIAPHHSERILCLHNVANTLLNISLGELPQLNNVNLLNLLDREAIIAKNGDAEVSLAPYQVKWLLLSEQ